MYNFMYIFVNRKTWKYIHQDLAVAFSGIKDDCFSQWSTIRDHHAKRSLLRISNQSNNVIAR